MRPLSLSSSISLALCILFAAPLACDSGGSGGEKTPAAEGEPEAGDGVAAKADGEAKAETPKDDEADADDKESEGDEAKADDDGETPDEAKADDDGETPDEADADDDGETPDEAKADDNSETPDEAKADDDDEKSGGDEAKADDDDGEKSGENEVKTKALPKTAKPKSKPTSKPKPESKPEPAPTADGRAVYMKKCKACHGTTGEADTKIGQKVDIDSFKEPGWKAKWPLSKIENIVTKGKAGTKMKAFEGKLTKDEIKAVSIYTRKLGA